MFDPIAELRSSMARAADANRPLRAVHMHPDDVREVQRLAAPTLTRAVAGSARGLIEFDGVPVYASESVPRGRPWYDPPVRPGI